MKGPGRAQGEEGQVGKMGSVPNVHLWLCGQEVSSGVGSGSDRVTGSKEKNWSRVNGHEG
jgi:hypothetical protein